MPAAVSFSAWGPRELFFWDVCPSGHNAPRRRGARADFLYLHFRAVPNSEVPRLPEGREPAQDNGVLDDLSICAIGLPRARQGHLLKGNFGHAALGITECCFRHPIRVSTLL